MNFYKWQKSKNKIVPSGISLGLCISYTKKRKQCRWKGFPSGEPCVGVTAELRFTHPPRFRGIVSNIQTTNLAFREQSGGLPRWSGDQNFTFQRKGVQVPSLVGKLRPHMTQGPKNRNHVLMQNQPEYTLLHESHTGQNRGYGVTQSRTRLK